MSGPTVTLDPFTTLVTTLPQTSMNGLYCLTPETYLPMTQHFPAVQTSCTNPFMLTRLTPQVRAHPQASACMPGSGLGLPIAPKWLHGVGGSKMPAQTAGPFSCEGWSQFMVFK